MPTSAPTITQAIMSWSGGKDSSMALYYALQDKSLKIVSLLTTVTEAYDRISMHGVRRNLLEQQAASIGIPVEEVIIPKVCSNEEYDAQMKAKLMGFKDKSVESVIIGDIFLEDLKKYREERLAEIAMKGTFPIWKRDTKELSRTFIDLGFKAILTCIDSEVLDKSFCGRDYTPDLLKDLPANVDPCGENGEFHSFVYDGPIFRNPVSLKKGEVVLRDKRFYFCDLEPV